MIIILLGLPGSGKGTQSQFLQQRFKLSYLSTGDILRKMIANNSSKGNEINQFIKAGKLVPSNLINQIVKKFFDTSEKDVNYLLDGYPRNLEQAEFLSNVTKVSLRVVYFEIDENTVIKRISGRFNCSNCGAIYNEWYDNTIIENVCDICQETHFNRRDDDNADIVSKRIIEYKNEIFPLVEYYKKLNLLNVVDANRIKEEISSELVDILKMI